MVDRLALPICRDLIDPHFEGYKLSLDSLPTYQCSISGDVDIANLTEEQYSFHHAKLLGVNNHLYLDPWCDTHVYFVSADWFVVKAVATPSAALIDGNVVQIPDSKKQKEVEGRHNVSMVFVAPEFAVVADGAGKLHIYNTGDRKSSTEKWRVIFSLDPGDGDVPFSLADSVMTFDDERSYIECLCASVIESTSEQKEKYKTNHLTVLDWISLTSTDQKSWKIERKRRLLGRKPFDFVAIEHSKENIIIAAQAEFQFQSDSLKPVLLEESFVDSSTTDAVPAEYTWSQINEDVSVQFTVPHTVTKADIYLILTSDHIDFGVKNSRSLLKGHLHGAVDVEGCTWTIQGQRVELTLSKVDNEVWPVIVVGDQRGEMTVDENQIAAIHARLAGLTSEQLNPDPTEGLEKPYNAQELEDCDAYPEDSSVLVRLDGNSHKVTHQTNLGSHQFLFTSRVSHDKTPIFCLRHDVDGVIWQPLNSVKEHESPWQHVATFNAFGYVQASKQQRKFTLCAPDYSYVAVCDAVRHCYVYRQPSAIISPVRNRKTGQKIDAVAKQQVVSLEAVDNTLGFQVTCNKLFIMTESKLFVVQVNPESV